MIRTNAVSGAIRRALVACFALAGLGQSAHAQTSGAGDAGAGTQELMALVLAETATPAEAEDAKARWKGAHGFTALLIENARGYPKIFKAGEVPGLASQPGNASSVVVLGFCRSEDVGAPLEFVQSLFPQATARRVSWPEAACPSADAHPKLKQSKAVEADGWRLLVNEYDQLGNGESTDLVISAGVFDAMGKGHQYEMFHYSADATTHCEIALAAAKDRITMTVKSEGKPMPCSGKAYRLRERVVFQLEDQQMSIKSTVLERKVAPLCD